MSASPAFNLAFERLVANEGAFTNDHDDPGNWTGGKVGVGHLLGTKYGIAANTYPTLDIANLTIAQAQTIYFRDFWTPLQGDRVYDGVAFQCFDAAVNHGNSTAIKLLQRALKQVEDGSFGPVCVAACMAKTEPDVIMLFLAARLRYFTKLQTFSKYGAGWSNRIATNLEFGAQDS